MSERLWTHEDELAFQIGDMHGEAFVPKRKGIKGKVDSGKHPGKRSHIRREQEADSQMGEAFELPQVKQPPAERKHITRDGRKT